MNEKKVWEMPQVVTYGPVITLTNECKKLGAYDGNTLCGLGQIGNCSQ